MAPANDDTLATVLSILTATVRRGEVGSADWRLYEQVIGDAALDMPLDPEPVVGFIATFAEAPRRSATGTPRICSRCGCRR
jgi:hypothetical protein